MVKGNALLAPGFMPAPKFQKEQLDYTLRSHLKICEMQQREEAEVEAEAAPATANTPPPQEPPCTTAIAVVAPIERITHLMLPPVVTSTSVSLPRRPPLSLTLAKVEGVSIETPSTVVPNISFDLDTPGASAEALPADFKAKGQQESDNDSES